MLMLTACALSKGKSSKTLGAEQQKATQQMQKAEMLKAKEDLSQERKDLQRIMQKKNEIKTAYRVVPQKKKLDYSPKIFSQAEKLSERDLYAELLNSYNRNDMIRFQSYQRSFMKRFKNSPLADDAIYLSGLLQLSGKQYGPALLDFNQVLNKYPYSNKTTAALYAKGVSLKRMNLNKEAKTVFSQVIKKYPGSPESLRAKAELGTVK